MGWGSIGIVFDNEPSWDCLEALGPDVSLRGYRHKNRRLWLLEAWQPERANEHFAFQSFWPERFKLSEAVTLPEGCAGFLGKMRAISDIVKTFSPNVLAYGMAVATLTGKRTYLWGADDDDFNLAMVVDGGDVSAFGAEGGMMNITWDAGKVCIQCTSDPENPEYGPAEQQLEALEGLSYTDVIREPIPCSGELYGWPVRIWPPEWGNPEEVLGLGTWDYVEVWDRELEVCYDRPGSKTAQPKSTGLSGVIKRIFGK